MSDYKNPEDPSGPRDDAAAEDALRRALSELMEGRGFLGEDARGESPGPRKTGRKWNVPK